MKLGALFPGQGSQTVGMGEELFERRPDLLGDPADEVLGWSLRKMCLDGPEETLTRTEHAQPAIFAVSYALWDTLAIDLGLRPFAAAGHSLGEYTALTAAGALDYRTALDVVARRGRAMAEAADSASSGMAALIGADEELARSVVGSASQPGGTLEVANLNAPGQIVVAGSKEDIDWLVDKGRDFGVRRVVPLKVAGAFHSSFMQPAARAIEATLNEISFEEPEFEVWSNTTAAPHSRDHLAEVLTRQVVSPVRFEECLKAMHERGVDTFIHVGPGDVTAGMARKSVPGATVVKVSEIDEIQEVADALSLR